jgi:hypothetical protein
MKTLLLNVLTAALLLLMPHVNFAQAPPLGTTASFALFTAVGAFSNDGATYVTGDIGTNVGAFTGFPPGTVVGGIHVADPVSVQAAIDVDVAYSFMSGITCGVVLGTTLGNGQTLGPNVYCLGGASTLNGDLILDGQGNPDALFIFKIDGALSTNSFSNIILINSASICNVFWQVNGALGVGMGANSVFRGTIISNGAFSLLEGASLFGRALSRGGAIALHNNIVTFAGQSSAAPITANGATTFCEGSNVILSGNDGGVWSNGAITPSITVNSSGEYFVSYSGTCGTATSNHIIVTVNPLPSATTGSNATICTGSSVTLGAASIAGHSYSWTPTAGLSSATISNPVASPLTTTTYTLTETITASGCQETNSVIVTVDQLITAATITAGGATTFCTGGSVILSGNNGGVWSNGATTPSITVIASGDFFVTNTNACGAITSNHIIVTVNSLPAAITGSDATICSGSPVTIGAASIAGHTYLWTPTAGLSSATISNPIASPTVTTTYTLTETITATGCQASNSVTLTVIMGPNITEQPASQAACLGTSASFTVTATGAGITYQWRKGLVNLIDGVVITGVTSATLTINPVSFTDAASDYNVVVTGTGVCLQQSVTSIIVSLAVNFEPVINIQPANQAVCEGNPVSFSVAATGTSISYQWRKGTVNLVNGGNISGATSAILTINPANIPDASANYNVAITGVCLPVVTSDNVALVVNSATAITTQPTAQTACTGISVSFSVAATGTGLTYQWRKGTVNMVNGGNISGVTSATLSINPVNASDAASDYNVVISGLCSANLTSANVALIVNTIPVITTAPANQVACEGNSVSFTVVATGTGLTYQWRKGTVNLVDGGNISGATSAALTINPAILSDAAGDYNVVVTGTCSPAVTSINVSLEVTAAPGVSISSCVGGSISFSATATGPGLTYQWRKGNVNLVNGGNISGATSATLTINPVTLEDASPDYNVVVTGACSPYAISKSISLVVSTPAVIVTQPVNQVACEGEIVSFSVAATGSGLSYQWRKGTVNLVNGGNISGATSAVLTFNPMQATDVASDYNVVITGACSSLVTSSDASLELCGFTAISPGNSDNTNEAFTVYPNPFRTSVALTVNESLLSKSPEFRMYNALGIQVMSSILTKNITTIGTSNLVAGIYLYQVIVDSETIFSGRLISQQ